MYPIQIPIYMQDQVITHQSYVLVLKYLILQPIQILQELFVNFQKCLIESFYISIRKKIRLIKH